jgi:hypothetical protein
LKCQDMPFAALALIKNIHALADEVGKKIWEF